MFLTVSDLKNYAYCPRLVYYRYVLPVEGKTTFKMEYGRISEEQMRSIEKRRKLKEYGLEEGSRRFGEWVRSERLELSGKIDLLIESRGGYFPVDFKTTEGPVQESHKMQLAGYALILEDTRGVAVERGFIFLLPREDIVSVELDAALKSQCERAIEEMKRIIHDEWMPEAPDNRNRCTDCEYRNFCRDIW
jgi:CRISPR-associated exonuclease Cas4